MPMSMVGIRGVREPVLAETCVGNVTILMIRDDSEQYLHSVRVHAMSRQICLVRL